MSVHADQADATDDAEKAALNEQRRAAVGRWRDTHAVSYESRRAATAKPSERLRIVLALRRDARWQTLQVSHRLALLVAVQEHVDVRGRFWPSRKTMAIEAGVSLPTIVRMIQAAEAAKSDEGHPLLIVAIHMRQPGVKKRQRSNTYQLDPALVASALGDSAQGVSGRDPLSAQGVSGRDPLSADEATRGVTVTPIQGVSGRDPELDLERDLAAAAARVREGEQERTAETPSHAESQLDASAVAGKTADRHITSEAGGLSEGGRGSGEFHRPDSNNQHASNLEGFSENAGVPAGWDAAAERDVSELLATLSATPGEELLRLARWAHAECPSGLRRVVAEAGRSDKRSPLGLLRVLLTRGEHAAPDVPAVEQPRWIMACPDCRGFRFSRDSATRKLWRCEECDGEGVVAFVDPQEEAPQAAREPCGTCDGDGVVDAGEDGMAPCPACARSAA